MTGKFQHDLCSLRLGNFDNDLWVTTDGNHFQTTASSADMTRTAGQAIRQDPGWGLDSPVESRSPAAACAK